MIPQLYAYTDCEVAVQLESLLVIRDRKPVEMTVSEVLEDADRAAARADQAPSSSATSSELVDRQHWMTLERIFVENRVYKKIETAKTAEKVREAVVWRHGRVPKRSSCAPMIDDDVTRLLEIRIRRISAYDIEKHRDELEEVDDELETTRKKLKTADQDA